jgi:Pyridoxamine 5'-phosphate oxidase
MYYFLSLLLIVSSTIARAIPPSQNVLATTSFPIERARIPTIHESAVMARRILRLENIGTLSTTFPDHSSDSRRPESVDGKPFGLMDYFADCEREGNPTVLAMPIASNFRNVAAGSNMTLSMRWHPPIDRPYSAAEMPRFALIGYLEKIDAGIRESTRLGICFAKAHPDSIIWMPGNRIHTSYWARMVVTEIYWLGGFGDRAYIGWIPVETFKGVTEEEIAKCKLPGEESD